MFSKVGHDLGLTADKVRIAISSPKGIKPIVEERYSIQRKRNQAIQDAKVFVETANQSRLEKLVKSVPQFFFEKAIYGHGSVGMITHAGFNLFSPKAWGHWFPNFANQFKYLFNKGAYEKAVEDLENHPEFNKWKRAGLKIDPFKVTDEYSGLKKFFGEGAKAGDRGFFALKTFRLGFAKSLYDGLSEIEKSDPNTIKEISKIVNHATGTSDYEPSKALSTISFAPKLEASRWQRIIIEPIKAFNTFTKIAGGKEVTPSERAGAKLVAKRTGTMVAVYFSALAVNQALLTASGSKDKVNFLDPSGKDWLKFKVAGKDVDVTGGMVSAVHFLANIISLSMKTRKMLHGEGVDEKAFEQTGRYIEGKFSPFASTAFQTYTSHDFQGNTMPWSNKPPTHWYNHRMTWKEYLWTQAPIPFAEGARDTYQQMEETGMSSPNIEQIFTGIAQGLISGGTGARVSEKPKEKSLGEIEKMKTQFKIENDRYDARTRSQDALEERKKKAGR
jgi:hypothetical protein